MAFEAALDERFEVHGFELEAFCARFDARQKFSTWLYTIARNLCLNEIRRRSRHPADSLDASHPNDDEQPLRQYEDVKSTAPPDALLRGELVEKVEQAIAELPEKKKAGMPPMGMGGEDYD